jgi:hypothetical protein
MVIGVVPFHGQRVRRRRFLMNNRSKIDISQLQAAVMPLVEAQMKLVAAQMAKDPNASGVRASDSGPQAVVGAGAEAVAEGGCFGSAGTFGTIGGCFGSAGTFGCYSAES